MDRRKAKGGKERKRGFKEKKRVRGDRTNEKRER